MLTWKKYGGNITLTEQSSPVIPVYESRSRIDYFLVSRELLTKIKSCWFVISDHAAISLKVQIERFTHNPINWRLQVRWLQKPEFIKFVEAKIDCYFELNTDQTHASISFQGLYQRINYQLYNLDREKRQNRNGIFGKTNKIIGNGYK